MSDRKTALIMAAGTGGHVFPALAVAKALQQQGYDVQWLGTPSGMENKLVGEANICLHQISIKGLRGKGIKGLLLAPLRIVQAVAQSISVIRQLRPGVVVGFGGYIAGPGGVAAKLSGVPLLIHEQNALAGLTNKWLSRIANVSLQAFPGALDNAKVVGNPVRAELKPAVTENLGQRKLRVLVVGGSLGAVAMNKVVHQVWSSFPVDERPELFHQVGARDFDNMSAIYEADGLLSEPGGIRVQAFIQDMAAAYGWADLVVCRSGALTVSELAATGKPAILVPYPYAVDDHQTVNAGFLEQAGAAIICQQTDLTADWLTRTLQTLIQEPGRLADMAKSSAQCAVYDATDRTVEEIERIYRDQ